jgi:hypothetical protein
VFSIPSHPEEDPTSGLIKLSSPEKTKWHN